MKVLSNFTDLVGFASLISFNSIIILISIFSQGALIYYYEPNKLIWISEVLVGMYGIIVGFRRMVGCLQVEEYPHGTKSTIN